MSQSIETGFDWLPQISVMPEWIVNLESAGIEPNGVIIREDFSVVSFAPTLNSTTSGLNTDDQIERDREDLFSLLHNKASGPTSAVVVGATHHDFTESILEIDAWSIKSGMVSYATIDNWRNSSDFTAPINIGSWVGRRLKDYVMPKKTTSIWVNLRGVSDSGAFYKIKYQIKTDTDCFLQDMINSSRKTIIACHRLNDIGIETFRILENTGAFYVNADILLGPTYLALDYLTLRPHERTD